jgi:hypothetical protein
VALCVNPKLKYVKVKDPATQKVYIVSESRLSALPGAVATAAKKGKPGTPGFDKVREVAATGPYRSSRIVTLNTGGQVAW